MHNRSEDANSNKGQILLDAFEFLMWGFGTGGTLRISRDAQGRTHVSGDVEELEPIVRLLEVSGREVIIEEPGRSEYES